MNTTTGSTPSHYASAVRVLIRFAVVMTFVAMISGILFQESSKKLDYAEAEPGLHLEATIHLALVHGHIIVAAVLLPIVMAGALFLARKAGGSDLSPAMIKWLTRGYLPFVSLSLALMLYKGYHVLLRVRGGDSDLQTVYGDLFGGISAVRHGVYAVAHVGMAVALCVFLVALWRSLRRLD